MNTKDAPSVEALQRARERERKARMQAEELLEQKSRELYENSQKLEQLASLPKINPNPVIEIDYDGNLVYANPAAYVDFPDLKQKGFAHPLFSAIRKILVRNAIPSTNIHYSEVAVEQRVFDHKVAFIPESDVIRIYAHDVTQQKRAEQQLRSSHDEIERVNADLKEKQGQLIQSEKMAGLGQLAAGVAHEINNPLGFVKGNISTLTEYCETFIVLLTQYRELVQQLDHAPQALDAIQQYEQHEDIEYILGDTKTLIAETSDGIERVAEIVKNLKAFTRTDEEEMKNADLNDGIESTLKIVWNQLKFKCEVVKDLQPLPLTMCHPGQLNQVFMNLFVNAANAIKEQGTITIKSYADDENIYVQVSDTGCGIPEENIDKIFNPFFTTKAVGEGTGLGLSVSYSIVQKHQGDITIDSTVGQGTTFTVRIPRAYAAER